MGLRKKLLLFFLSGTICLLLTSPLMTVSAMTEAAAESAEAITVQSPRPAETAIAILAALGMSMSAVTWLRTQRKAVKKANAIS